MADFNEIKGSVFSALGIAADKTRKVAGKAADKAKDVSRITKLNFEIKSANDAIDRAYSEIGKIYYETHKNAPDTYFVQLCEEITQAVKNIDSLQTELDKLKAGMRSSDGSIEVEFTEVKSEDTAASESDFEKPEEKSDVKPEDKAD